MVDGRGARPVWALQLQVLRELAQHAGLADILREQILATEHRPVSTALCWRSPTVRSPVQQRPRHSCASAVLSEDADEELAAGGGDD